MALKCANCDKGIMIGKQHKHHAGVAGGRWKKRAPKTRKVFKPNLHSARVWTGDSYKRMKLCTKCLRLARTAQKEAMEAKTSTTSQAVATA
jgi:ribosomal protein L28